MSKPSFYLDSGASDETQLTMNPAFSRLKMTTFFLQVCFCAMMDEIDFFCLLSVFSLLVFERRICFLAGSGFYTMERLCERERERLQSANLFISFATAF
jgi:hypothetical protein